MTGTEREIITVLLKRVFEEKLISEATYRKSLDRLHAGERTAPAGRMQSEREERLASGYPESEG